MTYKKTWAFALNTAPTAQDTLQNQCRSFFIQYKEFLVNSLGWVVASSSDGTTFSGMDLWGVAATKLNWNVSGSPRSHITLKSPEGLVAGLDGSYIGDQSRLWYTAASASNYYQCAIFLHRVAPTGGSTTASPTSASQITIALGTTAFNSSVLGNRKLHFEGVGVGENVGGVLKGKGGHYALISDSVSGVVTTVFALMPVTGIKQIAGVDYAFGIAATLKYAALGTCMLDMLTGAKGWSHTGTSTSLINGYVPKTIGGASIGAGETNTGGQAGSSVNASITLYDASSASASALGTLADVTFTGATITNLAQDASTPAYCSIASGSSGAVWIPANALIVA